MNPVSGKSDYLLEILHSGDSLPCGWALVPIGEDRVRSQKSPGTHLFRSRASRKLGENDVSYLRYGISTREQLCVQGFSCALGRKNRIGLGAAR